MSAPQKFPFQHRLWALPSLWLMLSILLMVMAGCAPISIPSPGDLPSQPAEVETVESTPEEATPTQVSDVDIDRLAESLAETIPLRGDGSTEGFDGVNIFPLEMPAGSAQLWVAHTYGIRSFDPLLNHFVALFDYTEGAWNEITRLELECADYVDEAGVSQAAISEGSVWLAVDGGAGAHSGCFTLLRWEGADLTIAAENFNSSPGAGEVTDINGDGQLEVVLNGTEPYIFCYACGVRLYAAQILRWNGEELVAVMLTDLPDSADATLRALNNNAVALAEASLYPSALALIREALTMAPDNEIVYWNAQEIELYAANRLYYAEEGAYPLLGYVFYGDYAAALDEMRGFTPEEIFSLESPLIVGTPAEMWTAELSQYLIMFANDALAEQPDLAEAYFLRGWGRFLANQSDPAVLIDVAEALQLAPSDTLIEESYAYLKETTATTTRGIPSMPAAEAEEIRFALGATAALLRADLNANPALTYAFEVAAGQTVYITAGDEITAQIFDATGQPIPGVDNLGATRFEIPVTGDYTLILQGNSVADVLIYIPPQRNPSGVVQAATTEMVYFDAGATGATLERRLSAQIPQGFSLGIGAGQRLFVSVDGNATYTLLDNFGRLLTPIAQDAATAEYMIPFNGSYTVVLQGSGPVTLTTEIPAQ